MTGANPEVSTPRPSRGTTIVSLDFIVFIVILDSSWLFYFAWPYVSSGSDGLYLSTLSDMSPATSDCLEHYFSFVFSIIARVLTFLGPLSLVDFSLYVPFLGS